MVKSTDFFQAGFKADFDVFETRPNNYYSVSGAMREIRCLYGHAYWVVYKWLNRRSQRRSFTLEKFTDVWNKKIKRPYIHVNIWAYGGVVYN